MLLLTTNFSHWNQSFPLTADLELWLQKKCLCGRRRKKKQKDAELFGSQSFVRDIIRVIYKCDLAGWAKKQSSEGREWRGNRAKNRLNMQMSGVKLFLSPSVGSRGVLLDRIRFVYRKKTYFIDDNNKPGKRNFVKLHQMSQSTRRNYRQLGASSLPPWFYIWGDYSVGIVMMSSLEVHPVNYSHWH